MKSKFGNLLNVGIENEEESLAEAMGSETADSEPSETEVTEDGVVDETLSADDTVEAGEGDIAEAEDGVDEATATMDELDEAADELDEAEATLESFLEDGGMSHQAAIAYGLTTKRLRKRLGAGAFSNSPSIEDFGGTGTRYQATVDSLEDIRETKDKVLQAISKYIEVAKKALKEFWVKIWDNSPRLKQRLKALAQAAERGTGEANSETVKIGSAKSLHIGGKIPTDMTGAVKKTVDEIIGVMKGMSEQAVKDAGLLAKSLTAEDESAGELLNSRIQETASKGVKADNMKGVPSGYIVQTVGDELMGGKKAFQGVLSTSGTDATILIQFASFRTGLVSVSAKADQKASEVSEAPTLPFKVIADTCDHAARGCDAVTNYRRDYEKRERAFNEVQEVAKKVAADQQKAVEGESAELKHMLVKSAAQLTRAIGKFTSGAMGAPEQAARHMLAVGKAVGQYGAASLKTYGEKKEESEEESEAA